jgi:UDP-N-acetylglucosamine 2-epimerase (non-hydrolysing)
MVAKILIVFGTRPEIIKLAPLIQLIQECDTRKDYYIVCTSQQKELLKDHLDFWNIEVDFFLPDFDHKSNLTKLLAYTLTQLQDVLEKLNSIEYILIQGDTNTALACSQLAFLNQLKLLHVEAGLRSFDLTSPFPEEFNRIIASKVAYFHFAPTKLTAENLIAEGVLPSQILITGNTVIDAIQSLKRDNKTLSKQSKNLILITLHRRENIDSNYLILIETINELTKKYPTYKFLWVSHPNCSEKVKKLIKSDSNFEAVDHLPYQDFISLYNTTKMIITDSGGVCEEAFHMGIPVVIFRKASERNEPLLLKYPLIITLNKESILTFFYENIEKENIHSFSYGDGNASIKIFNWIKNETSANRFDTVIIGGGPAGTGLLLKLMKDGTDKKFFDSKFALIEKTSNLVKGTITDYMVNSDTFSDVFLECLEGLTGDSIDLSTLSDEISTIKKHSGSPIPLNKLTTYLKKLGDLIIEKINSHPKSKLFLNTSADKIIKTEGGEFIIHLNKGKEKIHSKKLIIASGGKLNLPDHIQFSETISLNEFSDKIIHSDVLLKGLAVDLIAEKIPKRIVILGGSHSSFSSAWYLLNSVGGFTENSIKIWSRTQPLIYFPTKEDAMSAGYNNFTDNDICPITKRVYRLAGLRMDGRELLIKMEGLQNYEIEKRVKFNRIVDTNSDELSKDLSEADLIILGYGYSFNMIPFYNENNEKLNFIGEITGHWVSPTSELLDVNNEIIPNLYATGLATGFIPSGYLGGEPSFEGQTNGIWYYQNALAEVIIKKIINENIAAVP